MEEKMKDIAKISEARKMKYCRILLCMTALAACLMISIAWGEDYLEGGYFRSYDRSMTMDPGIAGMVQWLDAPISSFPWYSSDLTFYRQAVPSSTFTPYREYYKTTGTPVVSGIVSNPVKFILPRIRLTGYTTATARDCHTLNMHPQCLPRPVISGFRGPRIGHSMQ